MKCECCPASENNSGYEHDADDWWCGLGEKDREFTDGSKGCNRRSIKRIKQDLRIAHKQDNDIFAAECEKFCKFIEESEAGK